MEQFEISNKVAIITGGASGIGFQCAIKLLENGAKAVTVADIDPDNGKRAVQQLQDKFGKGKVVFVKTDVTVYDDFEGTFKETVEEFGNMDILINCAGIFNDKQWQKEIAVNINGVVHGMMLGLEKYIPKYKSGSEGLIINISSVAASDPSEIFPIYSASKLAVNGMTLAWGSSNHFERRKVRVVGICPGATDTPILHDMKGRSFYDEWVEKVLGTVEKLQSSEVVAQNIVKVMERAPNGTIWIVEDGEAPFKYEMPSRHNVIEKQCL